MKNYYQILEVSPDASQDIIKEQYHFLVQAWHPDKFPNPAQKSKAEERVKELNVAYEILRNPYKRAEYDKSILSSQSNHQQEYRSQGDVQVTQRRAEDEARKKVETGDFRNGVKVFINGKETILSVDQLVHASVQYFLEGESINSVFFTTRAHVEAFVKNVALRRGYEIHIIKLAGQQQPYRTGREWPVKSVKVFVERNGEYEECVLRETDLIRASVCYYFPHLSMPIRNTSSFLRNLQDVKTVVRKSKEKDFVIVVKKFAN